MYEENLSLEAQVKRDYQKKYLMDNYDERQQYFKSYYQRNRKRLIEEAKRRYQANRSHHLEIQKKYRYRKRTEINLLRKVSKALGISIKEARVQLKGG